jgi:arylsulfatase A-like enzyme
VLVTLDTTRADRLGCYGRTGAGTPNLDRLAASGVRFAEAWSAAPITLPSHLSMLTRCTPVTHGVRDNGATKYDGHIPTLAARFAAAGYRTAAVVSASVLDSTWGANAGFGVYDERFDRKGERSAASATSRALAIVRLRPGYVEALGNLGRIAYERGRIDEALSRYRAASVAAPGEREQLTTMVSELSQTLGM